MLGPPPFGLWPHKSLLLLTASIRYLQNRTSDLEQAKPAPKRIQDLLSFQFNSYRGTVFRTKRTAKHYRIRYRDQQWRLAATKTTEKTRYLQPKFAQQNNGIASF
jgi:hypothetical protein